MTKIIEVMRQYSLKERLDFLENGGEYPRNSLWCYDQIKQSGIQIDCVEYDKNSLLNRIGEKVEILNLDQQIKCLKQSKDVDLIFAPYSRDVFILVILKLMGIYKKPLIGFMENAFIPYNKQFLKRFRQKILRSIYLKGMDRVLFFSEESYNISNQYSKLKNGHGFVNSWGVDYDFFKSFTDSQKEPPKQDYIYTTGGTFRDFKTLVEAFNYVDIDLRITSRSPLEDSITRNASSNVIIDNSIKPGLNSVGLIRKEYYDSLAVAIPLTRILEKKQGPIGLTVILEAFSMGKPIISTVNKYLPFDIEKEKVGLCVDYGDVKGWSQAIQYLKDNLDEARLMGERAEHLVKTKCNYKLFSKEINLHINGLAN